MHEIHGTAMHYPWGTSDAIPAILGIPADGRPFAEYWLGAHPLAPSQLDSGARLDALLASDPSLLGPAAESFGPRLPFMMKLLSARHALSLQAHPSREKAAEGFAREEAAGIPLNDPLRSYPDASGKPEILVALSEFHLLVGFRNAQATADLFDGLGVFEDAESVLGPLVFRRGTVATEEVFLDVLSLDGDRLEVVNRLLVRAVGHANDPGELGDFARLIIELDAAFPGNPGIMAACLMNHVVLAPGEAVFIPPGTMHADISGTGVEVLANSDNVIRGGLTNKHIAVEELVTVVDFGELTPEVLLGEEVAPGVWSYRPGCPEFAVWRIESSDGRTTTLPGHGSVRIALVTRGEALMHDGSAGLALEHGQAVFLPAGSPQVQISGDAQVFVSAPGVP